MRKFTFGFIALISILTPWIPARMASAQNAAYMEGTNKSYQATQSYQTAAAVVFQQQKAVQKKSQSVANTSSTKFLADQKAVSAPNTTTASAVAKSSVSPKSTGSSPVNQTHPQESAAASPPPSPAKDQVVQLMAFDKGEVVVEKSTDADGNVAQKVRIIAPGVPPTEFLIKDYTAVTGGGSDTLNRESKFSATTVDGKTVTFTQHYTLPPARNEVFATYTITQSLAATQSAEAGNLYGVLTKEISQSFRDGKLWTSSEIIKGENFRQEHNFQYQAGVPEIWIIQEGTDQVRLEKISDTEYHLSTSPQQPRLGGSDFTVFVKASNVKIELDRDGLVSKISGADPQGESLEIGAQVRGSVRTVAFFTLKDFQIARNVGNIPAANRLVAHTTDGRQIDFFKVDSRDFYNIRENFTTDSGALRWDTKYGMVAGQPEKFYETTVTEAGKKVMEQAWTYDSAGKPQNLSVHRDQDNFHLEFKQKLSFSSKTDILVRVFENGKWLERTISLRRVRLTYDKKTGLLTKISGLDADKEDIDILIEGQSLKITGPK